MSLKLNSSGGGSVTLQEPTTANNQTLTLPDATGTVATTTDLNTLSATNLTSGTIPKARMFAGAVLQVVQSVKSDTFSTSAGQGSPALITGLSGTITPSSASSKVLVFVNFGEISGSSDTTWAIVMYRNGTKINAGDAAGSRSTGSIAGGIPSSGGTWRGNPASIMFLDSPATTSAVSYTFAIGGNGGSTVYVNRDGRDTDNANDATRTPTTIILAEIAA